MSSSSDSLLRLEAPVSLPDKKQDIQPSLSTLTASASPDLSTLLSILLPPRISMRDGAQLVEYASPAPSTRFQVLQLQDQLNAQLASRQARTSGLCPLRATVFYDLFSELIRQVAVDSGPRGVLLARLRDELEMREEGYRVLCDSGVRFGALKAQGTGATAANCRTEDEEEQRDALAGQLDAVKRQLELEKRAQTERRATEIKRRAEETDFLKVQGGNLDKFLETVREEASKESNK